MRMLLMELDEGDSPLSPLATKMGVTAGCWEDDALEGFSTPAPPGAVVAEARTRRLYLIDRSGDARPVGLRLPSEELVVEPFAPSGFAVAVSSHDTDELAGYVRASFDVVGLTAEEIGRRVLEACADDGAEVV